MALHMPPPHRTFVEGLRAVSAASASGGVRGAALRDARGGQLREAYNDAVNELEKFRCVPSHA
eukprot:366050-Chlamydomonas_euryale.AAC.18